MRACGPFHNRLVAAGLAVILSAGPALAEEDRLDRLFDQLGTAQDDRAAQRIEGDIWREWSRSGSPALDLLLERGREALAQGDTGLAIEHLTALTDHAPDFAEGWNARAMAYVQAGEYGPAIQDIRRTLALNPRHFGAMAGFATILEELGRPAQALEVYRAALAIYPRMQSVLDAVERLETAEAGQDL